MLTSSHWAKIGDTTVATRESFLKFKEFPGSLTYHTHVEDSKFINARRSRSRCDVISGSGAQLGRLLTVPWWWSSNFSASSFPCCWIFLNGVTLGQFEYTYIYIYDICIVYICMYVYYIHIYIYMYICIPKQRDTRKPWEPLNTTIPSHYTEYWLVETCWNAFPILCVLIIPCNNQVV